MKVLSDSKIEKLPFETGHENDPLTPGLYLRVGKRKKTWEFSYRVEGTQIKQKIGEFPQLRLADARAEVDRLRKLAAQGTLDDQRRTLREVFEAYLEDCRLKQRKVRARDGYPTAET
ncbi:Arm DNA-binding domain-containing protein, partial [Roseitalea porphyridii]|uniref:Arm DNA-binding domain-containing protein n=1 Tax=Roseitalea porphyridii TaxID=1852022 RepID=UPI0032ED4C9D